MNTNTETPIISVRPTARSLLTWLTIDKVRSFAEIHRHSILVMMIALGIIYYLSLMPSYKFAQNGDDAHYVLLARALASGQGLVNLTQPGKTFDVFVPPGYPLLLAPLAWLFPDSVFPLQMESLVMAIGAILATYLYLRLKRIPLLLILIIVFFLTFNFSMGLYATIVMPETAFVFAFMLLLIALHWYERSARALNRWALASVLLLMALYYLKAAALPIIPAVILYFALKRKWRQALVIVIGSGVFVGAFFIWRTMAGGSFIGDGYQSELIGNYGKQSGIPLLLTVVGMVMDNIGTYLSSALGNALFPTPFSLFWSADPPVIDIIRTIFQATVASLVIVGWFIYSRRYRDAGSLIIPCYFGFTLFWPYINDRRVILLLPLVLICFFVAVYACIFRSLPRLYSNLGSSTYGIFGAVVALLILPLALRTYQEYTMPFSSMVVKFDPQAPWMQFISHVPDENDVIASSNSFTLAYLTGRTVSDALWQVCDDWQASQRHDQILQRNDQILWDTLQRLSPRFVLVTALYGSITKEPDPIASTCVLPFLQNNPRNFSRVYSQDEDSVQIYEVLSTTPGGAERRNLISQIRRYSNDPNATFFNQGEPKLDLAQYMAHDVDGATDFTIRFDAISNVDTIVIGQASASGEAIPVLRVMLQSPDGSWQSIDSVEGKSIGYSGSAASTAHIPYYYLELRQPIRANAVRIQVEGHGAFLLQDLNVFGIPANQSVPRPDLTDRLPVKEHDWYPLAGKWDGVHTQLALFDGTLFHLPNGKIPLLHFPISLKSSNDPNVPIPVTGAWEGGAQQKPGVFYRGVFYVQYHDGIHQIRFGIPGDHPIVGDWDGDGVTTFGVYRKGTFLLTNRPDGSVTDRTISVRTPDDPTDPEDLKTVPFAGDWDGDGKDTPGLRLVNAFALWNAFQMEPDEVITFGLPEDIPLVGDWSGDHRTDIGVIRQDGELIYYNPVTAEHIVSVDLGAMLFSPGTPIRLQKYSNSGLSLGGAGSIIRLSGVQYGG
jgi:hypothetical protein